MLVLGLLVLPALTSTSTAATATSASTSTTTTTTPRNQHVGELALSERDVLGLSSRERLQFHSGGMARGAPSAHEAPDTVLIPSADRPGTRARQGLNGKKTGGVADGSIAMAGAGVAAAAAVGVGWDGEIATVTTEAIHKIPYKPAALLEAMQTAAAATKGDTGGDGDSVSDSDDGSEPPFETTVQTTIYVVNPWAKKSRRGRRPGPQTTMGTELGTTLIPQEMWQTTLVTVLRSTVGTTLRLRLNAWPPEADPLS